MTVGTISSLWSPVPVPPTPIVTLVPIPAPEVTVAPVLPGASGWVILVQVVAAAGTVVAVWFAKKSASASATSAKQATTAQKRESAVLARDARPVLVIEAVWRRTELPDAMSVQITNTDPTNEAKNLVVRTARAGSKPELVIKRPDLAPSDSMAPAVPFTLSPAAKLGGGGRRRTTIICVDYQDKYGLGWWRQYGKIYEDATGPEDGRTYSFRWDDLTFPVEGRGDDFVPAVVSPER